MHAINIGTPDIDINSIRQQKEKLCVLNWNYIGKKSTEHVGRKGTEAGDSIK